MSALQALAIHGARKRRHPELYQLEQVPQQFFEFYEAEPFDGPDLRALEGGAGAAGGEPETGGAA